MEREFGPLFSGGESLSLGGSVIPILELQRRFDLVADDLIPIDLVSSSPGRHAFRFYDGDDRCVVAFIIDDDLNLVEELRVHIAEWLENDYYESGLDAYMADKMVLRLWERVTGGKVKAPG